MEIGKQVSYPHSPLPIHDLESYFGIAAAVSDKLQFVGGSGERLLAGTSDKLQFVGGSGERLLAGTSDKLQFVGHSLAAFLLTFQVVPHPLMSVGGVLRSSRLIPGRPIRAGIRP